jgi:hypothetical protein
MNEPALDPALLPRFERWRAEWGKPDLNPWDYLRQHCDAELGALFSTLFWPSLVEIDGCVLLARQFDPETFGRWREHFAGDLSAVEAMVNHVHVYDLFETSGADLDLAVYEQVGQTLLRCWTARVQTAFPARTFAFRYATEPDEYGPTITFFQSR